MSCCWYFLIVFGLLGLHIALCSRIFDISQHQFGVPLNKLWPGEFDKHPLLDPLMFSFMDSIDFKMVLDRVLCDSHRNFYKGDLPY